MFLAVPGVVILLGLYVLIRRRRLLPQEMEAVIADVISREVPELFPGETGYADSEGVRIWYEVRRPSATPKGTIVLVPGLAGDALFWPGDLVQRFLDSGYAVVRFDLRGTGMSDRIGKWNRKNAYSTRTMAQDVVAVLDAARIERAHVLGVSLGGVVVHHLGIAHSDRLCSLTTIMAPLIVEDPLLPEVRSGYLLRSLFSGSLAMWSYRIVGGEKNLIRLRLIRYLRISETDRIDSRGIAEAVLYDRRKRPGRNGKAIIQHMVAVARGPYTYQELQSVRIPTLVIHGTDDPLVPCDHGRRLVEVLPKARGLWVNGAGHVFPFSQMGEPMHVILEHLESHPC